MILQEMIVTDGDGKISKIVKKDGKYVEKSLCGQHIQSEDMYSFYAIKRVNPPKSKPTAEQKAAKVRIMMPLGGELNGMYRFPRVGEKVVVAVEGAAHYLMGYLPTNETPFSPKEDDKESTDVFDEEGLVLRYKKTGENVADKNRDKPYSEIGFFREPSRWKTKDKDLQNEESSSVETDDKGNKTYYPYIDTVKVSSTGDLTTNAQNLNEIKGRRVSIESKFLFGDRKENGKVTIPGNIKGDLEERLIDEEEINKGDIYVNADNKIVISARNGIQLDCGGASISLDPTGISISAAKVDGLEPGEGPFDSEISLSHNGTVNLNGKVLNGYFGKAMFMEDGFGGGFICNSGNMDIFGRAVSVGASTTLAQSLYVMEGVMYTIEQMTSVFKASRKKNPSGSGSSGSQVTGYIEKALAFFDRIGEQFSDNDNGLDDLKKGNKSKKGKAVSVVTKILKLILNIVGNVRSVVEDKYYEKFKLYYDKTDGKFYTTDNRADVTLAFDIAEGTLVISIQSLLLASAASALVHEASISCSPNADIVLDSRGYYQASIMNQTASAAMAGVGMDVDAPQQPVQPPPQDDDAGNEEEGHEQGQEGQGQGNQQQPQQQGKDGWSKADERMDVVNNILGPRSIPAIVVSIIKDSIKGKPDAATEEELEAL